MRAQVRPIALAMAGALFALASPVAGAQCPPVPGDVSDPGTPAGAPRPLARPSSGVTRTFVGSDGQTRGYCLYEPQTASALSDTVVLYVRGAQLAEDGGLDAMLQTLASLGPRVVYPDVDPMLGPGGALPDAPTQVRATLERALRDLRSAGKPVSHLVASGFSLGGIIAARLTAAWTGTPGIDAMVLHDPAGALVPASRASGGGPFAP